jgi:chemotaxis protein MotB
MRSVHFYVIILSSFLVSCVSTSKFKAEQQEAQKNDSLYVWSQRTLKGCQDDNARLNKQKVALQEQTNEMSLQLSATKENYTQMRKQLHDLAAISSAQAESIKKSLDNMGAKDIYFRELQSALTQRDETILAVMMNLKAILGGMSAQDLSITVEKGAVYVDLPNQLLFNSDSTGTGIGYTVANKAKTILSRIARVLNDQPNAEVMVEGHIDSVSIAGDSLQTSLKDTANSSLPDSISNSLKDSATLSLKDNATSVLKDSTNANLMALLKDRLTDSAKGDWELSIKRATAIAQILQHEYNVSPTRITATGRTTPGRTRIVILPQMDQLLKVLEHKQGQTEPTASTPVTSGS